MAESLPETRFVKIIGFPTWQKKNLLPVGGYCFCFIEDRYERTKCFTKIFIGLIPQPASKPQMSLPLPFVQWLPFDDRQSPVYVIYVLELFKKS